MGHKNALLPQYNVFQKILQAAHMVINLVWREKWSEVRISWAVATGLVGWPGA